MDSNIPKELNLQTEVCKQRISMASSSSAYTEGRVKVDLCMEEQLFKDQPILLVPNLCCDLIIGHDILSLHDKLVINFKGKREKLHLTNNHISNPSNYTLAHASVDPPSLFSNLSADCHPIACRSRKYSDPEQKSIRDQDKHAGLSHITQQSET